jgi:hypothetical protein
MNLRCGECFATTWLDRAQPVATGEPVKCDFCAKSYVAEVAPGLEATVAGHYNHALAFSNENEIDMASAYSVMLGILTLEEARFLHGVSEAAQEAASALEPAPETAPEPELQPAPPRIVVDAATRPAAMSEIDPGFLPAVKEGALSFEEALHRGERGVFAARIQSRHKLSQRLALMVADNRISLRAALAEMESAPSANKKASQQRPGTLRVWQTASFVAIALVMMFKISTSVWQSRFVEARTPVLPAERVAAAEPQREQTPPRAEPRKQPPAELNHLMEVSKDAAGNPVRIVGPDPASVLEAYCKAASTLPPLEVVAVTETTPPSPTRKLGVFRDFNELETLHAIWIRRDHKTRRWVAGTGGVPIPVRPTSEQTTGTAELVAVARLSD